MLRPAPYQAPVAVMAATAPVRAYRRTLFVAILGADEESKGRLCVMSRGVSPMSVELRYGLASRQICRWRGNFAFVDITFSINTNQQQHKVDSTLPNNYSQNVFLSSFKNAWPHSDSIHFSPVYCPDFSFEISSAFAPALSACAIDSQHV